MRLSFRPKPFRCRLQVVIGQVKAGEVWTSRRCRLKSPALLKSLTLHSVIGHLYGRVCLSMCFLGKGKKLFGCSGELGAYLNAEFCLKTSVS